MIKNAKWANSRIWMVTLVVLATTLCSFGATQNEPIVQKRNRYLLLDERIIGRTENAEMSPDKPWEHQRKGWFATPFSGGVDALVKHDNQ